MEDGDSSLDLTVNFSPTPRQDFPDAESMAGSSSDWWSDYWKFGAFADLTGSDNANAKEPQRRIILSQYNLAVNEACKDPPQESGLVNNGWYGKFYMEMAFWHLGHWVIWGKWSLLGRSVPGIFERFLPGSIDRARYHTTTKVYDLGPPMYPGSESTNPNVTINPTFELAYWRFGLSVATTWKTRQHLPIPAN